MTSLPDCPSVPPQKADAFTLLELLLVMVLAGILVCSAGWGSGKLVRGWHLERAGQQLYEDLKSLQATAEMAGNFAMSNGVLVSRRHFFVFELETQSYAAYRWLDRNVNDFAEDDEAALLWRNRLPPGVVYGRADGIDRRACSNTSPAPGAAVSFASPGYPPCHNRPCIKFDRHGFSVMGPGAVYLSNGEQSLALTGTRPGLFTLCQWNGERWQ